MLSAPIASATCSLSQADDQYINLLAQNKMVHNADYSDCHEAAEGRWFADQVRANPNPFGEGQELVNMITRTTPLSQAQAEGGRVGNLRLRTRSDPQDQRPSRESKLARRVARVTAAQRIPRASNVSGREGFAFRPFSCFYVS